MPDRERTVQVCHVGGCHHAASLPAIPVVHSQPTAPTWQTVLLCDTHRAAYHHAATDSWLEHNIPSFGS
jgi:hypothetical protein